EHEHGGGINYFSGNPGQLAAAMAYAEKQGMLKTGKNEWHIKGGTYTEVVNPEKKKDTGWTIIPVTGTEFERMTAEAESPDSLPAPALQPTHTVAGMTTVNQENVKNAEIAYLVARGFMAQENY